MSKVRKSRQLCVGLQMKSALILALIVLSVTAAGGWFYLDATREMLRASDRRHAAHLAKALAMAAQYDLRQVQSHSLQRLASDFLRNDNVRYVGLLDSAGRVVALACGDRDPKQWAFLTKMPVAVSTTRQEDADVLILARPIIMRDLIWYEERLVGAVRIVFDTTRTTAKLAQVQRRMTAVAAAIVLSGIPLGYVLVWHLMLKPVKKLVSLTGLLAKGDFGARAKLRRRDEIGQLASSFDTMAHELAEMRDELLEANELLEQKVALRTEELQVANTRLRDEMAEKEEFLRAVSHDLNAPLRNVAGMATMVMMKWRDQLPEEVVARLQRIQINVDEETSLIAELLELSRIRTRPQRRQVIPMGRLLTDLADTFEYELNTRNIDLKVVGDMPSLYVEKNRLRQVFQNLIDNAIKYMHRRKGGRIRIGYRRRERMHEFSVSDNGPGIPADQREKVFCIFRRADAASSADVPGKGVGLATVKSVVSNYDGRAWVDSEVGIGSTFYVALDADNTRPPQADPKHEPSEPDIIQDDYHPVGR